DLGVIDAQAINTMKMGEDIEIRVGRYGAYLQEGQGDERKFANIPEGMAPDELTLQKAQELLAQPSGERVLGNDPVTGLEILAKSGRFGPYVTEVLPEPEVEEGKKKRKIKDAPKPKTASLFSSMSLDTITLEDALKLLSLPRAIGEYEGVEITAQNGRYGPYLRHGTDSRTLTSEDQIFSLDLDEAIEIYKQPKVRRRGVAKPPLKDLGVDPESQKQILVKDGRFGAYVTDGETNATLRRGDTLEAMTLERGLELLAGRRAWELENGDAPKKRTKRATSKSSKKAPTLTENTVEGSGAKRKAMKSASGRSKKEVKV
ncbi:MAG: topoisomerase C-terminal repeat-containing protein, partial [Candidatus Nanopelagicaceae bacterium]